jgi:hypothetical protein
LRYSRRTEFVAEKEEDVQGDGQGDEDSITKVDETVMNRLMEIQEEFLRRDKVLGALAETEGFSEFVFNISDVANTAKAIKSVCEVFEITMDDFFAAFGYNAAEEDDEEEEEEEEEGEEGEEEEPEESPAPPKKKGQPILDNEFIKQ